MSTSKTTEEFVELKKVKNTYTSWLKKIWQRVFVAYEIAWWIGILIVLFYTIGANLKYLPVLMPDTFAGKKIDTSLGSSLPNLIAFHSERIVPNYEYVLDFSYKVPDDLPVDTEKVTFFVSSDFPGAKLEPTTLEYSSEQKGWVIQQVKLIVLEGDSQQQKVVIHVKSPELQGESKFEVPVVNRSYSIGLLITFAITFGAVILKVLQPLFTRIFLLITKKQDVAPQPNKP